MTGNKQAKKGSSAWKGKGRGRDKKKRKQRPKLSEEEKMSRREEMEAKRTVEKKAADAKGRSNFMSLLLGKKQKEREGAGSGGETEGIDGSDASSEDERSSDESEGGDGADIGMVGDEAIDNNPIECSMIGGHEDDDDDVECSMIGGGPEEKDDDDEDSITDYLDAVGGYSDVLDLPPVTAELDHEEEIDIDAEGDIDAADAGYDGGNEGATNDGPLFEGVIGTYVYHVHERLKKETSSKFPAFQEKWLLAMLKDKENGWWLRKEKAERVCKKLGIQFDEPSYYRDILVWLPDIRWGQPSMPCCPGCKCNQRVKFHAYRTNHFSRTVIGLKDNYYMISRRYICHDCKEKRQALKQKVIDTAAENDIQVEISAESIQYTFMGWNFESVSRLPHSNGNEFPAFLTWRGAVDKDLVDLMRPGFDKGLRPEAFSEMLLELHAKHHAKRVIKYERELERKNMLNPETKSENEMYSTFSDKLKYNGLVPTGKYLAHVYRLYHKTIKNHFAKEVKKRGAERLHIDASYKEAKHLSQYHGHPIFKALVTATNEFGEIRMQFHVVTDGHDQMRAAIAAFVKTSAAYGQPGTQLVFTDNPSADKEFYIGQIPTVRRTQEHLDADASAATADDIPLCRIDMRKIITTSNPSEMNRYANAIKELLHDRAIKVIGLDAEWDVDRNRNGEVIRSRRIALIQIAYVDADDEISVVLFQVAKLTKLPSRVLALFQEEDLKFAGVNVGGDLAKIGRDLDCKDIINGIAEENIVNLGRYARERDVVPTGNVGLEELVLVSLNERLSKEVEARLSKWSSKELSEKQKTYAALDAKKSLELYRHLLKLPDLTVRLMVADATEGRAIDIVPKSGNVACMATRAGWGKIVNGRYAKSPAKITPAKVRPSDDSRIVQVDSVAAPHLIVPGMKTEKGDRACLGDFGEPPFQVVLPLQMMRDHVEKARVLPMNTPDVEDSESGALTPPAAASVPAASTNRQPSSNENEEDADIDADADVDILSFDDDAQMPVLSADDIEYLRLVALEADETTSGRTPLECPDLDPPPDPKHIANNHSAVLGDGFHAIYRPKVPTKHESKKAYHWAFQNAMYAWHPEKLDELKDKMKGEGLTDKDIESDMYFKSVFFRDCIPRAMLQPRLLYWRVRAVFVVYGNKLDSKTGQPLFNKRAWGKAKNVLKEILLGYYSDPPGFNFYTLRFKPNGEIMTNKYGVAMIECNRSTSRVEAIHKQLLTTFGTWHTGVEMSDCLMAERRHRFNHRCSERRRLDFPILGHYDTWLVDLLQTLVLKNHGVLLYPSWSNTSDYKDTPESFGTVALHSEELASAVESAWERIKRREKEEEKANEARPEDEREKLNKVKLTGDQNHLCDAMGVPLPFTPVNDPKEIKLFARLELDSTVPKDDDALSVEWCKYVDGINIFPKLPVHFRNYRERFERNQRVRDAVKRAREGAQMLNNLNTALAPATDEDSGSAQEQTSASSAPEESANALNTPTRPTPADPAVATAAWPIPQLPQPMRLPHSAARHNNPETIVGGVQIGETAISQMTKHKMPARGKDKSKRRKRGCGRCIEHKGDNAYICSGRGKGGRISCEYFEENGDRK